MKNMMQTILRGYHWPQSELEKTPCEGVFYIALNLSSECNLRCMYCFAGLENLKRSNDEMDLVEKLQVIHEAKECGARVLVIPGRGEPFLDPDFWKVIEEANHLGLWVVVYTNGLFLDQEKILRLKGYDISIYLKVDSFRKNVYEKLVGKTNSFERLEKNLDILVRIFHEPIEENGVIVSRLGINSVISTLSFASIPRLYHWCIEKRIFYTCRSPVKVGEAELTWECLVENDVENLRFIGQKYATRTFTSATEAGQCGIYRFGITVDNNGKVFVCPDAHEGFEPIGNIRKTSLQELVKRRNEIYPLNSSPGYCFAKSNRNQEEIKRLTIKENLSEECCASSST